jgi:predicted nuclease with TOPRIM domain
MPFKKFDVDKAIIERFGSIEEFDRICERLENKQKSIEFAYNKTGSISPKNINGKWYIELGSKELGNILVSKNNSIEPREFASEEEANEYIKNYLKEGIQFGS